MLEKHIYMGMEGYQVIWGMHAHVTCYTLRYTLRKEPAWFSTLLIKVHLTILQKIYSQNWYGIIQTEKGLLFLRHMIHSSLTYIVGVVLLKSSVCNFYQNFNIHTLRCDIHDEQVHRLASSP